MARTKRKPNDINPVTGLPQRFHAPREERVVSSVAVESGKRVPRISLSGSWLEQVGFREGVEFLVLADVPDQILLVLANPREATRAPTSSARFQPSRCRVSASG